MSTTAPDEYDLPTTPRRWRLRMNEWLPRDHIDEACVLLDTPPGMPIEEQQTRIQRSIAHSWIAQNKMIGQGRA